MLATTLLLTSLASLSSGLVSTTPMHPLDGHSHSETLVRVFSDVPSGSVAHTFPRMPGGTVRTLLPKESETFFIANGDRDLVVASDLGPYAGRTLDFVVVEGSADTLSRYRVENLRVSVVDATERVAFNRPSYSAEVPENLPAGSLLRMDEDVTLCSYDLLRGVDSSRIQFDLLDVRGGRADSFSLVPLGSDSNGCLVFHMRTNKPLDRETTPAYGLTVRALDDIGDVLASTEVRVDVGNEDDNLPVFQQDFYDFEFVPLKARYPDVGSVRAVDADGDAVLYVNVDRSPCCVVVPQTGHIVVLQEVANETVLRVGAHQVGDRSRAAADPAVVVIRRVSEMENEIDEKRRRDKRRVTRAVRPTKRIEFTEKDGNTEGKIVFQLEKESEHETFRIRDENPWVTVEPNGAVRVKKNWDFEELGREKTIDFWVIINNSGAQGRSRRLPYFFFPCLFSFSIIYMVLEGKEESWLLGKRYVEAKKMALSAW